MEDTFSVFNKPETYSFWASMIIRTLSDVLALLGCWPVRARKDWAMFGYCD